jgi:hypothetical protein
MRNLLASAGLLTAIAFAAAPAQAGPMLGIELHSGSSTFSLFSLPGATSLTFNQAIGNFTTTVNTGTTTQAPGLDLSSVEISSTGGGTLTVTLSASGFASPFGAANWLSQFSGNFVTGSAVVTLQTYLDNSDMLLNTSGATLLGTLTDTATPFGISVTKSASTEGSFALTEVLTITTTGAAHVSLDGSVSYVPEPASMAVLGAGLIGLGTVRRRSGKVSV